MAITTYIDALAGAYFKALNGKITLPDNMVVPVYRDFVDVQHSDTYYILIQSPSAVGAESKCDTDQDVSIQLVIYCRGLSIDTYNMQLICSKVYGLVYNDRNHLLIVPGYQHINQRLVSDNGISDMDVTNNIKILERIIIFNHSLS